VLRISCTLTRNRGGPESRTDGKELSTHAIEMCAGNVGKHIPTIEAVTDN